MIERSFPLVLAASFLVLPGVVAADAGDSTVLPDFQVTATRSALDLDVLPAAVTVITARELSARGAQTLSDALAGVAGVEVSPSGDNGPAGSVPSFWGLREFDAFLLVVDGVPAGGAFNPALTTLDLNNVERIEVLRGAAPVMYGATSFVGVIHVIHYPAGQASQTGWVRAGGVAGHPGSVSIGGASALAPHDGWRRSLSGSLDRTQLADEDAEILRGQMLYRSAADGADGRHWRDVSLSLVRQTPESPVVFEDGQLTTKTPLDANHNPSDAVFEELRVQWNRGHSRVAGDARVVNLLSVALTGARVIRGFLEDPDNAAPNADGYKQTRGLLDLYLDHHVERPWSKGVNIVYGADALVGYAAQKSELFEYTVDLAGRSRPELASGNRTKEGEAFDGRVFAGAYGQANWRLSDDVTVLGGVRLNATYESRNGEREDDINGNGVIDKPAEEFEAEVDDTNLRLTGTLGASWRLWSSQADGVTVFADYRNSFKPAAFEFAPEIEAEILNPETANSVEAGLHATLFTGALDLEMSGFYMDFRNVLVAEAQGVFNVGATRLQGGEAEIELHLGPSWDVLSSYAYHEARYIEGLTPGGVNLAGNAIPMAPRHVVSLGLRHVSDAGVFGEALATRIGERFLDSANTGLAEAYTTVNATIGYRHKDWTLSLIGRNLTDRRDPISQSEFSEVATTVGPQAQPAIGAATAHYLLPARTIELRWSMPL